MVRRCVIEGCESKSSVPEHKGVTFHSFPFDSKTREVWIENCHIPADKNITKNILVCSRHFRRADFQPIKNGKFLLKSGSIPTVFSWKKNDSSSSSIASAPVSRVNSEVADEAATTSTVEATIASIMAETDKLNRAAGISTKDFKRKSSRSDESPMASPQRIATPVKIDVPLVFTPGVRLEVQEINGQWHSGKVVEVDNDDREVLIKFEKSGKSKRAESEEWIPMNSPRLRQKASAKPPPLFVTDEKCFARWTGSRKFPATVQKVLGDDLYEVLFEDGFVKTVRGNHMGKIKSVPVKVSTPAPVATKIAKSPKSTAKPEKAALVEAAVANAEGSSTKTTKPKKSPRKDWPLISMETLDLPSLNLPEVPQDGEWTCHWVNDQPIGREGFLLIGEHKKPTVIVDDWRLPPDWVKHMYQRSNVLGKWDVILVNPAGKRFRSKADLKQALEDAGQVYNPDIYDFSIHRRRAKDINAYVYTPDYKPPPKPVAASLASPTPSSTVEIPRTSVIETPIATPMPPMELMTPPPAPKPTEVVLKEEEIKLECTTPEKVPLPEPLEDGFAYIGGLKVEIIDNLFRCPQTGCFKNFRKENHLQIHVKHYHQDLIKLLGECPNMQDLALKRTIGHPEAEPQPKNQIPNQQFFAKMHQIDLQSRSHRKSSANTALTLSAMTSPIHQTVADDIPSAPTSADESINLNSTQANSTLDSSVLGSDVSLVTGDTIVKMEEPDAEVLPVVTPVIETVTAPEPVPDVPILPPAPKKSKMSVIKSVAKSVSKKVSNPGARKSNRQRTTKKYLTSTPAAAVVSHPTPPILASSFDSSFGGTDFEDSRHSLNGTPDKPATVPTTIQTTTAKKPKPTPVVTNEAITTVEGSLSGLVDSVETPQYIKENGELIKIVRMRQEEIINCLCNYGEEDGLMIQCELCLCWQHGTCNGIEKESDVPDKYVCVICSNPQCGRESRKYVHDQDWMYEGKLPAANYHEENPMHPERFEILKKSHTLAGNLVELKRFLHSLQVKINIAGNKDHPKMYLWEKRWDPIPKDVVKVENDTIKLEDGDTDMKDVSKIQATPIEAQDKIKIEPNIPQPEAPIDPVECQHRLLEHIKVQQNLVLSRLDDIEAQVNELEAADNLPDMKSADIEETKDVLATFIKELEIMKSIAKINAMVHKKKQQMVLN
ncbi:uncharacterized protein LOC129914222 [Episyrphus balteatus]|uniref:uncharacterized protein LOC129914222 n=1 Tax=Episyrphus balteatus TaxID=286459 RepID=UPI002485B24B|nr:uncharacterized protein LOC129914222 [Episyrphus balteatus]